jgi:hypothetical protein
LVLTLLSLLAIVGTDFFVNFLLTHSALLGSDEITGRMCKNLKRIHALPSSLSLYLHRIRPQNVEAFSSAAALAPRRSCSASPFGKNRLFF